MVQGDCGLVIAEFLKKTNPTSSATRTKVILTMAFAGMTRARLMLKKLIDFVGFVMHAEVIDDGGASLVHP